MRQQAPYPSYTRANFVVLRLCLCLFVVISASVGFLHLFMVIVCLFSHFATLCEHCASP